MSFTTFKIDDLKGDVSYACVGGPFGSELTSKDYVDEGVPVIRGANLPDALKFRDDSFVFVSEQKAAALISNMASPGDLIFTQRGTLGQVGLIPLDAKFDRYVVSQSQMKLTVDKEKVLPEYLFYYFRQPAIIQAIKGRAITSGVPHINLTILKGFEVKLPKTDVQKQAVKVLSPYDNLIENNNRRIALLEESARLLYREWFVYLRFPGHEHVKVVDGVPEVWEHVTVPEIIEINPTERLPKNKEIWYVPMASLSETGMTANRSNFELRTDHTAVKFRNRDVLLARITPCLENGKTGFAYFLDDDEVACGSTEFIVMRGKRVSPAFTYCLARSRDFREYAIKSMIGSSGRQRVQASCFNEFWLPLPPPLLLQEFDRCLGDVFSQIRNLALQNEKLAKARDLLLPRLMSGEITV